jgi:hypothetical protein
MRNSYITSQVSCQKHSRQARQPEKTKLPGQNLGEPASSRAKICASFAQVSGTSSKEGLFTPWVKRLAA